MGKIEDLLRRYPADMEWALKQEALSSARRNRMRQIVDDLEMKHPLSPEVTAPTAATPKKARFRPLPPVAVRLGRTKDEQGEWQKYLDLTTGLRMSENYWESVLNDEKEGR